MNLPFIPLALLLQLQQPEKPQLPLGQLEYVSLVALETAIIWILWRTYREKDKMLEDLLREQMQFLARNEKVLERFEEFLESLRKSPK